MKRNKFSLSHYKLLSMNQGALVPISCFEVLPGDTVQQATNLLVRVSPLVHPVMHPVHMRVHHWFVPNRLLWDNWEKFITGGPDGNDNSSPPSIAQPAGTGFAESSLADYLGICPGTPNAGAVSALPFRAYALIWNEWYRDQDLQTELVVSKADGADTTTNTTLQNVCWEKDYFTTARPWAQKGTDVTIPMGSYAPVLGIGAQTGSYNTGAVTAKESDGDDTGYGRYKIVDASDPDSNFYVQENPNEAGYPFIRADLANISNPATINELRTAFALHRYQENRARFGSRYTEYLRYLGVRSSDARLQRPEYLGGGKETIQFSEILQTAPNQDAGTSEDVGVGELKGHGIGSMRSNRYRRFFEEHGIVITLLSVKPKTMYTQGLPRMWSRTTKEAYWQKELQHIGQQEILNQEIYAPHATPLNTFGYQDRYDEYRRLESSIAGEFRTTLNDWHMSRIFSSDPTLNGAFVTSNPTDRIYASTTTDQLLVMANHNIQARRLVAASGGSSFVY